MFCGESENALMHFEPSKIREIGPDWHVWLLDLGLLYFCQKIKKGGWDYFGIGIMEVQCATDLVERPD